MSIVPRLCLAASATLLLAAQVDPSLAPATPQGEPHVVSVGSRGLTLRDLQARFDLYGQSVLEAPGQPEEARRSAFIDQIASAELRELAEAERLGLERRPVFVAREKALLAQAIQLDLERKARAAVTPSEIEEYFERHREELSEPARVLVFRIVVKDEERARAIIKECEGAKGLERWRQIARDESIDRATHLRGGDLGFVAKDGSTHRPQLRVDPRIFDAVAELEEGQIAPSPLKLDDGYAVLWRRGSLPERVATLPAERGAILERLVRERWAASVEELTSELSKGQIGELHEARLELIALEPFEPERSRERLTAPGASASTEHKPPAK